MLKNIMNFFIIAIFLYVTGILQQIVETHYDISTPVSSTILAARAVIAVVILREVLGQKKRKAREEIKDSTSNKLD